MLFFAAMTCAVLKRCRVSPGQFAATWTRVECAVVVAPPLAWFVYSCQPYLQCPSYYSSTASTGNTSRHADAAGIVLCQSMLPSMSGK
jgi:hypothetical protein